MSEPQPDRPPRKEGRGNPPNGPMRLGRGMFGWVLFIGLAIMLFLFIYGKLFADVARQFRPEFILVSAGFDIYGGDPLGGMDVGETGFAALAAELVGLSVDLCGGRLLVTLEGGYSLLGLRQGAEAVLLQMAAAAPRPDVPAQASAGTIRELVPVIQTIVKSWKLEI